MSLERVLATNDGEFELNLERSFKQNLKQSLEHERLAKKPQSSLSLIHPSLGGVEIKSTQKTVAPPRVSKNIEATDLIANTFRRNQRRQTNLFIQECW